MINFLTSQFSQCIMLPVMTTALTIFLRSICRPDRIGSVDRNTFNVGFNLCVTAIFLLASKCIYLSDLIVNDMIGKIVGIDALITYGVVCFAMVIGAIIVAYVVRKNGWEYMRINGQHTPSIFWGIVFPDTVGIVYLILVFNLTLK